MDSIRVSEAPDTGSIPVEATNFHLPVYDSWISRLSLQQLKQKTTIQKSGVLFLMLVFAISIAPKAYFHDLVANHKDVSDCRQFHHSIVLHQENFNCHFDDLVVSTPFLLLTDIIFDFTNLHRQNKQAIFYSSFLESFSHHKENRGPPSA